MLKFGERNSKRKVLCGEKPVNIWDREADNTIISK